MDRLLTVSDVSRRLACRPAAARALVASGSLPSVTNPTSTAEKPRIRVRESDLDAYIASLPISR